VPIGRRTLRSHTKKQKTERRTGQDDGRQYSHLPFRANTHLQAEGKELRLTKATLYAFDELGASKAYNDPCARIQSWLNTIENNLKAAISNNYEDDGNANAP
jgi:hypothetical protein